jgi:hypothetical protein
MTDQAPAEKNRAASALVAAAIATTAAVASSIVAVGEIPDYKKGN